jgi:hypothetical protein
MPERTGNTQILKAMPKAFVSARLDWNEIELPSSVKRQIVDNTPPMPELAKQDASLETVQTIVDEQITVTDMGLTAFEDDNAIDPRLFLMAVAGAAEFNLRCRLTRIGRNHDNDIALNGDRVSRYHAEIIREGETMKVIDLQSRNGVWVNGQRIKESAELKPGDRLRIGKQEFTFVVKE